MKTFSDDEEVLVSLVNFMFSERSGKMNPNSYLWANKNLKRFNLKYNKKKKIFIRK